LFLLTALAPRLNNSSRVSGFLVEALRLRRFQKFGFGPPAQNNEHHRPALRGRKHALMFEQLKA
jgi:hypothetical protein